jgi:hypothetical protein
MDQLEKKSDMRFEDVIAWAELPQPFHQSGQLGQKPSGGTVKPGLAAGVLIPTAANASAFGVTSLR